jgi:hypothetical protein
MNPTDLGQAQAIYDRVHEEPVRSTAELSGLVPAGLVGSSGIGTGIGGTGLPSQGLLGTGTTGGTSTGTGRSSTGAARGSVFKSLSKAVEPPALDAPDNALNAALDASFDLSDNARYEKASGFLNWGGSSNTTTVPAIPMGGSATTAGRTTGTLLGQSQTGTAGQTRLNPNTGVMEVFNPQTGQWVPMSGGAGSTGTPQFGVTSNVFRIYGDGMSGDVMVRIEAYVFRTPLNGGMGMTGTTGANGFGTNGLGTNGSGTTGSGTDTGRTTKSLDKELFVWAGAGTTARTTSSTTATGANAGLMQNGMMQNGMLPEEPFRILAWKVIR